MSWWQGDEEEEQVQESSLTVDMFKLKQLYRMVVEGQSTGDFSAAGAYIAVWEKMLELWPELYSK